jgi:hypothetical protein
MRDRERVPPLPERIGPIAVPQDRVSADTWVWANTTLPRYLLDHSVRSFCWGAELARRERRAFDRQVLWTAALFHDVGLSRLRRNTMCFEVEGAERARAFLERHGMDPEAADRAAIAIILHMQPSVTLDDGVEAVLLDRATSIDVRGEGYGEIDAVRDEVVGAFPRGAFDRRFLDAIRREVEIRSDCQSARLLHRTDLAAWMARSPWSGVTGGRRRRRA